MAPRTPRRLFRGNAVFPAEGGTHARPRAPGSASTGATNGQRLERRLCPARQSGQNEKEQRLWISIDSRIEGLNNERQWIPIDSLMKKEKGTMRSSILPALHWIKRQLPLLFISIASGARVHAPCTHTAVQRCVEVSAGL